MPLTLQAMNWLSASLTDEHVAPLAPDEWAVVDTELAPAIARAGEVFGTGWTLDTEASPRATAAQFRNVANDVGCVAFWLWPGDDDDTRHDFLKPWSERARVLALHVRVPELDPGPRADGTHEPDLAISAPTRLLRFALAHATRWPGMLLWSANGDATFLDLPRLAYGPTRRSMGIRSPGAMELASALSGRRGPADLELARRVTASAEHPLVKFGPKPVHLVHISDLHFGTTDATQRIRGLETQLGVLRDELSGNDAAVVPVVTGDLMNTPSDDTRAETMAFLGRLKGIFGEKPIIVLGNHDVRRSGWLGPKPGPALPLETQRVTWIDEAGVGLVSFSSVSKNGLGTVATGYVGPLEMQEAGSALDEDRRGREYLLVALLHHHPVPVEIPDWYKKPLYERIFPGDWFERGVELTDAPAFLAWMRHRRVPIALHGHQHIPRVRDHAGILVVGAGSSTGHVPVRQSGAIFASINVVTIDAGTGRICVRMMAERVSGGGFRPYREEFVFFRG